MMDQRIINRAQNFKNSIRNIQKYREERSLTLRKEKIFDNIMNKRMTCLTSTYEDGEIISVENEINIKSNETKLSVMDKWSIHPSSIIIPQEDLNFFENIKDKLHKVETLKQFLLKGESNGYNYKNFAIYHIKLCFLKIFQSISIRNALLDEELCSMILNEFLSSNNIAALCDLGFILTQITYYSEKACDMFLDENILKQFIDKITIENIKVQENILIIIGNVITQNKQFILLHTDYFIILKQMLINQQNLIESLNNSEIRKIILWNISLIINKMANQELAQFECLIPIFKSYLKKENLREMKRLDKNQDELNLLLSIFSELSNNDVIIESLIVNRLFDDFVYLLQYLNVAYSKELKYDPANFIILNSNNLLLTLTTLNNIFCGSDVSLIQYNVLNPDLIEIFENLILRYRFFQKEDKKVVKEIIWVLSNMIVGPLDFSNSIMGTGIPKSLLRYYANKDPNILIDILFFFEQALIKGGKTVIVDILKLNFIKFLFDSIKSNDDQNLIKICLNCIGILIKFSQEIYSPLEEKYFNSIHNEFMKHSIITRLEQLAIHNNPQISILSQELLKEVEKIIDEDQIMS